MVTTAPVPPGEQPIRIAEEMRTSYLTYAMSVIVARALPDVRDGLKAGAAPDPLCQCTTWAYGPARSSARAPVSPGKCWASFIPTARVRYTTRS